MESARGSSSVGRAAAFQAACRGFDPRLPLQLHPCSRHAITSCHAGVSASRLMKYSTSHVALNPNMGRSIDSRARSSISNVGDGAPWPRISSPHARHASGETPVAAGHSMVMSGSVADDGPHGRSQEQVGDHRGSREQDDGQADSSHHDAQYRPIRLGPVRILEPDAPAASPIRLDRRRPADRDPATRHRPC